MDQIKNNECGKYRNIVFTLNNYTNQKFEDLKNCELFKYVIIGKEVGESGTLHLQGYAELVSQTRFNRIKMIDPRLHIEKRFGSQYQAIEHCKKENDCYEFGEKRVRGERTDLLKLRDEIKNCLSQRELLNTYEVNASQLRVIDRNYSYLEPEK